jgi:hypothetical protein
MDKDQQLGVRVPSPIKEALKRAAVEDARSVSSLVEKILGDWLRERGYMKKGGRRGV